MLGFVWLLGQFYRIYDIRNVNVAVLLCFTFFHQTLIEYLSRKCCWIVGVCFYKCGKTCWYHMLESVVLRICQVAIMCCMLDISSLI